MLLLLAIAAVGYTQFTERQTKASDYSPQNLPPITRSATQQYRVTEITSANLFGDPRPKIEVVKDIPKTNLNLKLIGVLWASNQDMARVIIQSGNKKAGLYSIGDSIKGAGASVQEIRANEILINRNGATEKLLIKKKNSKDIITYESVGFSGDEAVPVAYDQVEDYQQPTQNIGRSNRRPVSPNGENRKIRKPNFSGLDRALQKMGEI